MSASDTSVLDTVKAELASTMTPSPDLVLADLSPLARLYFVEQLGYALLTMHTADVAEDAAELGDGDSGPARALQAISVACGALDEACIAVGLLPEGATTEG